tara:strand:+ start:1158 stop:2099 length:942 start_codon:yes stop_codon:yes gene_type:complete
LARTESYEKLRPPDEEIRMTASNADAQTVSALQSVLVAMIDPIDQLFFHSRMLRAWGHNQGMARNMEWIFKMQRTKELVGVLAGLGGVPTSRPARTLDIGADPRSIYQADAAQTRWFLEVVEGAHAQSSDEAARAVLEDILGKEWADLAVLEQALEDGSVDEEPRNAKFLLPKPGGAEAAIKAANMALATMTSAVSQIFFHSLIFDGQGRKELAERELNGALSMMYRSEALLERLLDLGGIPSAEGHGAITLHKDEQGADAAACAAHDTAISALESGLALLDGRIDPMSHSLVDGILRAERDDRAVIAARLAA